MICTLTALVVISTNVHSGAFFTEAFGASANDSAVALGVFADNLGITGKVIFSIILPLFAFTTILAWSYYGEKATEFCFGWLKNGGKKVAVIVFKIIYVLHKIRFFCAV